MKWPWILLSVALCAFGGEEDGQWYDWQGKPVVVDAAVAEQRTEADWVPGWLVRERERQAVTGRKRWSYDHGWYGYGWADRGYWFGGGSPRYSSWRGGSWGSYHHRGGGSSRWCVRVNTPGLHVNWCR